MMVVGDTGDEATCGRAEIEQKIKKKAVVFHQ